MNLTVGSLLILLFATGTSQAQSSEGTSAVAPVQMKRRVAPPPAGQATPTEQAQTVPVAPVTPAPPAQSSQQLLPPPKFEQPAARIQTPAQQAASPAVPSPAVPPPAQQAVQQVPAAPPPIPQCNTKDPRAFTQRISVIDNALKTVVGYENAFTSELGEEEFTMNQCRSSVRKNKATGKPEIGVSNCNVGFSPKPVKACQNGNRIRFVEDTSGSSGFLTLSSPMVIEFEKVSEGRWMVHSSKIPGAGKALVVEVSSATKTAR